MESGDRSQVFELELSPARRWELLIVPNEHLDVGYTDFDWKVAELQSRTVEQTLAMVEKNPDFRFTFDGYWIVEQFLRNRTASEQERLFKSLRAGKLSVPAVYSSAFTGFASSMAASAFGAAVRSEVGGLDTLPEEGHWSKPWIRKMCRPSSLPWRGYPEFSLATRSSLSRSS